MGDCSDWDQLVEAVEDMGGLLAVQMLDLRDLAGWDRLTTATLRAINDQAKQAGLGYFPRPLSQSRHASVRVYRLGTPAARLIEAVLDPTDHGDQLLRDTATGDGH